ncbi:hypothetical protein E4K72_11885 [Oxalobacteraceae bacterium OM1]|nr:hypothetical protein E4K72_11885 [Oxalobacteraceae bacterium OM1]
MGTRKDSRSWARLRLLCCSGLELMSLVPDAFSIIHELVPHAASAIFLTHDDGTPHGFFHEDSPREVQDTFLNEPQLFTGPAEYNVFRLVGARNTRKIGQLLEPPPGFFDTNTYHLLVRASGHHYILDGRLEVDGRRAGLLTLYRETGTPFKAAEAEDMARIVAYFEHALRSSSAAQALSAATYSEEALIIVRPDGRAPFVSAAALDLLDRIHLAGPEWPDRRLLPPFCLKLLDVICHDARYPRTLPSATFAVPGGCITATAHWLHEAGAAPATAWEESANSGLVGIHLKFAVPQPLAVWRRLRGADLSPQQMSVAFWMAAGGRAAARSNMGISEAVLQDCVKAVYGAFGCSSEEELRRTLNAPASGATLPS